MLPAELSNRAAHFEKWIRRGCPHRRWRNLVLAERHDRDVSDGAGQLLPIDAAIFNLLIHSDRPVRQN
jgi:hypothetical protein